VGFIALCVVEPAFERPDIEGLRRIGPVHQRDAEAPLGVDARSDGDASPAARSFFFQEEKAAPIAERGLAVTLYAYG
jgi:hypothetical protein